MHRNFRKEDITNIKHLCQQVIEIQEYRGQLYEYLKNRMLAIAPNLTVLVGELVGDRLIVHAGSLMNLAKHQASTVQILEGFVQGNVHTRDISSALPFFL